MASARCPLQTATWSIVVNANLAVGTYRLHDRGSTFYLKDSVISTELGLFWDSLRLAEDALN